MPFKSDKQRKYLFAKEPEVAHQFAADFKASGGLLKRAIANTVKLPDLARMRSGGMVKNGSVTPGGVKSFRAQCKQKFRDS